MIILIVHISFSPVYVNILVTDQGWLTTGVRRLLSKTRATQMSQVRLHVRLI